MKQEKLYFILIIVIGLTGRINNSYGQYPDLKITHYYIEEDMKPATWGTGGFTVNDFDKDGDFDLTIEREGDGKVYWYRNNGSGHWQKFIISTDVYHQLGASSLDVNMDGYPELIMGTYWLQNPGHLNENPDQIWNKYKYNGAMTDAENHDIVAADINNDGKMDVVSYSQDFNNKNGVMRWYDLTNPGDWKYHDIDTMINKREKPKWNNGVHAGFAPHGIGDLNNDGWNDIVMPSGWYENPGNKNKEWILHRWTGYGIEIGIDKTPYGTSIRSWICDLNRDGNNDIIITDSDVENSKAYIIFNLNGAAHFTLETLPFPDGPTGSLHSLGVADLDGDGDLDIFSGEQEDPDPGMKPAGLKERGFIWVNEGTANHPDFKYQIINTDNPGWHDTVLVDMDGDGDIDMVNKVWNADEGTDGDPDRKWHIDYWRNETIKK